MPKIDINDPEVKAELQQHIEAAVEQAVQGLKAKNQELLAKLRKATQSEVKPEDYQKALEDIDALKAEIDARGAELKKAKAEVAKLNERVNMQRQHLERTHVEEAVTAALVKAGVRPEFLPAAKALHRSAVKVIEEGDGFRGMIGDQTVAEAIAKWAQSDEGKHFVAAPSSGGGGASGSAGAAGGMRRMSQAEFERLPPAEQMTLSRSGKLEIVANAQQE